MNKFIASLLGGFVLLVGAMSSAEAFPVPGCDLSAFDFVARDAALFEPSGNLNISTQAVLVTSLTGLAKVGAFNKIGTIVAHRITVPHNAQVTNCIADIIDGAGSPAAGGSACQHASAPGAFTALGAACNDFAGVAPPFVIDPCVDNVQILGEIVGPGVEILPPGCYRKVVVLSGATAQLQAGNYFIRELVMQQNAKLDGVGDATNIRVKLPAVINPGSELSDFRLFTANTTGETQIGNNVKITNVTVVSPSSGIHIHTGSFGVNAQFAAVKLAIEPSQFSSDVEDVLCECPPGFRFAVPVCTADTSCNAARLCVPN